MPRKLLTIFILIFSITLSYSADKKNESKNGLNAFLNPEYWKNQALSDIIPFWEKTIDKKGGFFTDVNQDGSIGPLRTKYPRMQSRAVFGFTTAYLLSGDEKYLKLAQYGLAYLTNYGWDRKNGGWYQQIDGNNQPFQTPKDLFDETYGNLGPIFYYFATHDRQALSYVEKTHRLIQTKTWDQKNGGYYGVVNTDWSKGSGVKSFNAEIDTCSAYLIYYYLFTRNPALLTDLKQIADAAVKHMVSPKTGFVGETFSEDWKSINPTLWTGHNLKTGWVLLRTSWLTGEELYADTALKIAEAQMKLTWDSRYYGWFFQFSESTSKVLSENKDWWTQEEGNVLMLNLYHKFGGDIYLQRFKEASSFWDQHMIDHQNGECYPTVSSGGIPIDTYKGSLYKSAYHTMEQSLFNYLYLNLYVNKGTAELYFNLSSETKDEKHYVIPLEDPKIIIAKVTLNGKPWEQFNAKEGTISLPAGKNMKVKVTYGVGQ